MYPQRVLEQIEQEIKAVINNPDHNIDKRLDDIRQAKYKLKVRMGATFVAGCWRAAQVHREPAVLSEMSMTTPVQRMGAARPKRCCHKGPESRNIGVMTQSVERLLVSAL